jgi:hypothetical protein
LPRLAVTCLVTACLVTSVGLAGCGSSANQDPTQVTAHPVAAAPASSPPQTQPVPGTVLPAPPAEHTACDPDTGVLALAHGSSLTLLDTRAGAPPRELALASPPGHVRAGEPGHLLAALPDADQVVDIDVRAGTATPTRVPGGPTDAVRSGDQLAVSLRSDHSVTFLPSNRKAPGFDDTRLFSAGGEVLVLDRPQTSVTPVRTDTAEKDAALRAGQGSTEGVTDRYGRLLVTDTRDDQLLAFSTDPLVLKQRYPSPGKPYGIAYDPRRDLAWVTLTGTNQLVGYDVAGGEPQERYRFPTVQQPNGVAVDPASGHVLVSSATGAGVQVVAP